MVNRTLGKCIASLPFGAGYIEVEAWRDPAETVSGRPVIYVAADLFYPAADPLAAATLAECGFDGENVPQIVGRRRRILPGCPRRRGAGRRCAMSGEFATLQAMGDAVAHAVSLRLNGRMSPEQIERAASYADVSALAVEVRERIGVDAMLSPWAFYADASPRGLARNLILIYSRACELKGVVPGEVAR
jgi:hypothetical protein